MHKALPAALLAAALWTAAARADAKLEDFERVPVRPGDRCIVDGDPLSSDDVALVVRGRRVPIDKACLGEFLARPETYFSKLQPKGALFTEAFAEPAMRSGWFLAGLYVLTGVVFGALCAYVAVNKGLSPAPWFFGGLASNVLAFALVMTRPRKETPEPVPPGLAKVPLTHRPSHCPACGFEVHPAARVCPGCKAALSPAMRSEAAEAR